MRHFLYSMTSMKTAPSGGGDTASWFKYYKIDAKEPVFVPTPHAYDKPEKGDLLWFAMDGVVIGHAPFLMQQEDAINNVWELWFDSSEYVATPQPFAQVDSWVTSVPEHQAKEWLQLMSGKN